MEENMSGPTARTLNFVFSGDLVKSYDFMFTKDSYVVGTVIIKRCLISCSGTDYLHIRILADCRIVDGEEARNYERMGEMCYVTCVGAGIRR